MNWLKRLVKRKSDSLEEQPSSSNLENLIFLILNLKDIDSQGDHVQNTLVISLDNDIFEQQVTDILEDRDYDTYLSWTNEIREAKIQQLESLIAQPKQTNDNKSELYHQIGSLYAASKDFYNELQSLERAINLIHIVLKHGIIKGMRY
ncbi:MAG: hypothetical protein AB4058_22005 [Microcystaceae cyanobacterium]